MFLQVSLPPARCYSGALESRCQSLISPFLTPASPLSTHSPPPPATVSTDAMNLTDFHNYRPDVPINPFLPLLAYVVLTGRNGSSVYSWRSDVSLLTLILRAPPAISFLSLRVPSLNSSKTLLASTEEHRSTVYEFTSVSNQSDFIPRYSGFFDGVGGKKPQHLEASRCK